jgi:RNase P subunit RPR2
MLLILAGSVLVYVYYLKEKKEQLASISRGFCPKCHQKTIELIDERSAGCSGPKLLSFECTECGYHNSFSVDNSCGTGGCC